MKKLLCLIGWHDLKIVRNIFWGNCHHAELYCARCNVRYEGFVAGRWGYVKRFDQPTDWWLAYDSGTLPKVIEP